MRLSRVPKTSISQCVTWIRPQTRRRSQVVSACTGSQMLKGVGERRWILWGCCSLVGAGSHRVADRVGFSNRTCSMRSSWIGHVAVMPAGTVVMTH